MKALHTIQYRLNAQSGLYTGYAAECCLQVREKKAPRAYLEIPTDSGPEAAAVGYSEDQDASYELNLSLRMGNPSPEAKERRDLINQYLASRPADPALKDEPLYRRIMLTPEEVSAALKHYRPGRIVTEDQFTSTSRGGVHSKYRDRNVEFVVLSHSGRSIADISEHPDEREVLIPAGTRFKVMDAYPGKGLDLNILLKEVE